MTGERKASRYHCGPYGVTPDENGDFILAGELPKEIEEQYVYPKKKTPVNYLVDEE